MAQAPLDALNGRLPIPYKRPFIRTENSDGNLTERASKSARHIRAAAGRGLGEATDAPITARSDAVVP